MGLGTLGKLWEFIYEFPFTIPDRPKNCLPTK